MLSLNKLPCMKICELEVSSMLPVLILLWLVENIPWGEIGKCYNPVNR